eukprot:CAMPEP_0203641104 /NCGR_PEP_ID=MMETSP0088-20131115/6421_1 /ASSEMBLY_ACC=CAM_ASM_001087 /TAXON_ID=426623 /ORGANISM="Chaetoceros affinis, Strain CCMP159" /LENGTH=38 /DNA_ID= /DNA_START= /DNA_END= /DNA_ORIENTATION=
MVGSRARDISASSTKPSMMTHKKDVLKVRRPMQRSTLK